jgi:hypothetical protein
VSPAYGFAALALVKCSNEGGPGHRYNRKEDPGSSIFIMLKVHGCHLYCTLCPVSQKQVITEPEGWLSPPHQSNQDRAPSHPLQVHTPPPAKVPVETRLGGNHASASDSRPEAIDWARGRFGDHFGLFSASVRGQVAELEARAGQPAPLLRA